MDLMRFTTGLYFSSPGTGGTSGTVARMAPRSEDAPRFARCSTVSRTCQLVLVCLFPPLTTQFFRAAGEFFIGNRAHRLTPRLGPRLGAEDFMLQLVELALDAVQAFFHGGGFHERKLAFGWRAARHGSCGVCIVKRAS